MKSSLGQVRARQWAMSRSGAGQRVIFRGVVKGGTGRGGWVPLVIAEYFQYLFRLANRQVFENGTGQSSRGQVTGLRGR